MIEFHLDSRSGVSPYMQIVQQVRHALRLGLLSEGDQLPTVKEVVAHLAINPNTVLKAYRELEHRGLAAGRPGQGTFIEATLRHVGPAEQAALRATLTHWLRTAADAGLDSDGITALFTSALRDFCDRHEARPGDRGRGQGRRGQAAGVA